MAAVSSLLRLTPLLVTLVLFYGPSYALSRSGGIVGGSLFSDYSSLSSSASSDYTSSYSVPVLSRSFAFSSTNSHEPIHRPSQLGFWTSCLILGCVILFFVLVCSILLDADITTDTQKLSVLKLHVGLRGSARALQQDLDRLAKSADTSTSEGLAYVLTEATSSLLRHPEYCISCYSSVDVRPTIQDGNKRFKQLSTEERNKSEEETLVNVNSIKRQSSTIWAASGFRNEYIVVTILVAAKGIHELQPINGTMGLIKALHKLGSIPKINIMAVQVLWTPQNKKDVLSERELHEDYPLLRPL